MRAQCKPGSVAGGTACPTWNVEVPQAEFDQFPASARSAVERLQDAERQQAVLEVLRTLSRRDRAVLVDLFITD